MQENEQVWIRRALIAAEHAGSRGDVPVGAVVVHDNTMQLAGVGWNMREAAQDPTGHAEIMALRDAARTLGRWRLDDCTLYVTLEPCTMCAGAIVAARIRRLVFGAWDPKAGAAGSIRDVVRDARVNHQVEVIGGVCEAECSRKLLEFFAEQR
ncbi:MAG: tRNA adenosine(34) deaminase TadA [Ancrocorticia sp.]|jgi:tRNA(adenine34) deaminase|nr:tRNA adenosine(34) deaminase TadA [Ancrocorticia sp.]MCI1895935.1 tRNA adenosine(34) deaminase TadA [Ancrocorticia sp.]MCI1932800.1 tRNA adenosine(34) deaminase TadA [Ancrocorticia sp.]MCI1964342.1 tRNA adenosine(34) deaminase TadA [Ancrocorticia sp.]MCI2002930.1 tRNA adenosine(34) deaminase TadA [Ancrocorticia sp.]